MEVRGIKKNAITSSLLALSMVVFAFRGKFGAIIITLALAIELFILFKNMKIRLHLGITNFWIPFLLIFSVICNALRSINYEYYLHIGYLFAIFILLNTKSNKYDKLWSVLKGISLFEAFGIYLQRIIPSLFYSVMSIILPGDVVAQIRNRVLSGYMTGFSREVSYTMFLICIGIGLYWYDCNVQPKLRSDSSIVKKRLVLFFLFGALFLSGKRATLIFSVFSLFITGFINSKDKFKVLKYFLGVCAGIGVIIVFYPFWSKISSLQRIVELLSFIQMNDYTGITNGRVDIYSMAISLWENHPIIGIGWGNFKYSISESFWYSGFDVHNCFLQVLCENGYVGAIPYYCLIITSLIRVVICNIKLRKIDTNESRVSKFLCYVQFFFVMYSITEPILYEYTDYIIFFVCINLTSIFLKKTIPQYKKNNVI